MNPETIAVIDFGSQTSQLIARRIREHHVHSKLFGPAVTVDELAAYNVKGIVLSGGPASVYAANAPRCDAGLLDMGVPVLGICYGMQLACYLLGGLVEANPSREYGRTRIVRGDDPLLAHIPNESIVWMSHADMVSRLDADFVSIAKTDACPIAAVRHKKRPIYGLQFHPEVTHTPGGSLILRNFVYDICGCTGDWRIGDIVSEAQSHAARLVGPDERVICGLSGGVDSGVTAALLREALGDRLVCIYVDNGLMRRGETDLVRSTFQEHFKVDLHTVDAADQFLKALDGVEHPQEKRKIIGREFIDAFKRESATIRNARFLAQGTTYPDVIESGVSVGGIAASIKLHHNVGGLPAELGFELIEPLRELFKDEVRRIGEHLGLPEDIVWRHPFPGPGLAIRIMGAITQQRIECVRHADAILIEEIRAAGWYPKIAQALAVLVPVSTVGVMGDGQSYAGQNVIVIRLVESADFMTADWVHIDYDVLARISTRIINEVDGVNRVTYDISSKPPATIEWG